jgi:diguanylate cyclase (GGDEF)-like protein
VAMAEAAGYAIAQNAPKTALGQMSALFVAGSSSFDTGAEWLLTLGCVLVVSDRIQRELLSAQDELRALADRDPLTALANRRALPAALRKVQPAGATFLFFDLDHFKEINDVHGHEIGDQCLKTFAGALQSAFRPDDHIVRYGGDEFLVIASGLDSASIDERIALVRTRVRDSLMMPRVDFSVGRAYLEPGGKPEETLRAADAAMYTAKTA